MQPLPPPKRQCDSFESLIVTETMQTLQLYLDLYTRPRRKHMMNMVNVVRVSSQIVTHEFVSENPLHFSHLTKSISFAARNWNRHASYRIAA